MKITHQDIIDKEFRVKFRGFDMAEVDTFLEEVAEIVFKLTEENTQLNEKVFALQEEIESVGKMVASQGQMELPAEMGNFLEELKQDTATINAELVALKQDRSTFASLDKNIKDAVASLQKAAATTPPRAQAELPADLSSTLDELKTNSETIAAEMAALKTDRQTFDSLQKSLEEVVSAARESASGMTPQAQAELPADLSSILDELKMNSEIIADEMAALKTDRQTFDSLQKSLEEVVAAARETAPAMTPQVQAENGDLAETLDQFRQGTETMSAELTALKQEVGSIQQTHEEIKTELQELLKSHFDALDDKLSKASAAAAQAAPKAAATGGPVAAATIEEEPEVQTVGIKLPDFEEQDEAYDDDLEFLSEDDILDVDKLRGVFQSVLDNSVSDTPNSREDDDDSSADLLFLEDYIVDDEHEPEVTFSMNEESAGKKPKKEAEA